MAPISGIQQTASSICNQSGDSVNVHINPRGIPLSWVVIKKIAACQCGALACFLHTTSLKLIQVNSILLSHQTE